ncbi:MAG TPA: hypothetical protein VJL87_01525 [Bdellovibrionota bacterium]|nr:hypothetical protein [Bdellovibrionota bacterium]
MDIIRDQKKMKKRSGSTSEKSLKGKLTGGLKKDINLRDKKIVSNFNKQVDSDYGDPKIRKYLKEQHQKSFKRYGFISAEDFDEIVEYKELLRSSNPKLTHNKAFDIAYEKLTGKKLPLKDIS